jgi:Protein of unknown function (DUF2817)
VWLDVHTGLGPLGKDTFLSSTPIPDDIRQGFSGALFPQQDAAATAVLQGYEDTVGMMNSYFTNLLKKSAKDVHVLTQEFGTVPIFMVGHALMMEQAAWLNWSRVRARVAAQYEFTRRAFYPNHKEWRKEVLERGMERFKQGLAIVGGEVGEAEAAKESVQSEL